MVTDSIIEWASGKPDWQQDALRRIALSSELVDADISAILTNLKQAENLLPEANSVLQPLRKAHLKSDARDAPLSLLCSISDIKYANRLAPDQELSFALDGITLIYGQNGSGKSGYCRILKKVCRAIVEDSVLPDVFTPDPSLPAEACIRYKLNGATGVTSVTWRDGEDKSSDIAHLSVFDSHNARLYVDSRNRIDYLPYEIELLTRYGQLLERLRNTLLAEIREVDLRLGISHATGYTSGTRASELVDRLTSASPLAELPTIDELNAAGEWSDQYTLELEELQQTLRRDPQVLADRCRRVQGVVSNLIKELAKILDVLSQDIVEELERVVKHARVTAEAASHAATILFKDEPLPHVGSDVWQQMFQYAKEYSRLVYPGVEQRRAREGDLCVLCQQPLAEEAAERIRRFEDYVAGEVTRDAQEAVTLRDEKALAIKKFHIRSVQDTQSLLGEYAEMSDVRADTAVAVEEFILTAHKRRETLLDAVQSGNFSDIVGLDRSVINKLSDDSETLAREAVAHDGAAVDDSERETQRGKLNTLLDRKRLSENLIAIRERRNDLELRNRLQKCFDAARTQAVSHKVTTLRRKLVTENLNNRILAEVDALDLAYIPLVINDDSRKGESGFEVTLDTEYRAASHEVLSEGEQRALGLACFLADVRGQPVKHGIIVDDPVSSLDHVRVRQVAARLVEEAATGRQVIVFTHDLLFFTEMRSMAASHTPAPVPILTHFVRRVEELGYGVVEDGDEPWEAKPTHKRISHLQKKVKALEAMNDKYGDAYRERVKDVCTALRETWERLVEEELLHKVVERYGSDVKTQRLKGVKVEDEDYRRIFWSMKYVSEYSGHDMASAKNKPLPSTAELKKKVEELNQYRNALRKRIRETSKNREVLEQPPQAITA